MLMLFDTGNECSKSSWRAGERLDQVCEGGVFSAPIMTRSSAALGSAFAVHGNDGILASRPQTAVAQLLAHRTEVAKSFQRPPHLPFPTQDPVPISAQR